MDRLFLDANVLFSAAWRPDAGVRRLWDRPGVTLLTSEYAVEEARRNLATADQLARLDALLEAVTVESALTLDSTLRKDIELREKDWPILAGAVAAGATHLITGDMRDFGPFMDRRVLGLTVLTPARYLASTR